MLERQEGLREFPDFEFGNPNLKIREPRDVPNATPRVRQLLAQRRVTLRGQWHLWVYCCGWRIRGGGNEIAHSESSDDDISVACLQLDGQAIQQVTCEPDVGRTLFHFDLGGVLETEPYDDELLEQWMLYLPDGKVYTFRSDGAVSFGTANRTDEDWELVGEQGGARADWKCFEDKRV